MKRILYFTAISVILFISPAGAYSGYGSRGDEVIMIQQKLNSLGYGCGTTDGIYGHKTVLAVKEYQKNNSLYPDGVCGSSTLNSMGIVSDKDIDLLAKVINGEARGESFEGQIAVGAVVLNRVRHPSFPDTIREVIYQKGAFTAISDGQIKKAVTGSCRLAALKALSGYDPSCGALYYYNPKTATCKWIKSRTPVKSIGNHLFCK